VLQSWQGIDTHAYNPPLRCVVKCVVDLLCCDLLTAAAAVYAASRPPPRSDPRRRGDSDLAAGHHGDGVRACAVEAARQDHRFVNNLSRPIDQPRHFIVSQRTSTVVSRWHRSGAIKVGSQVRKRARGVSLLTLVLRIAIVVLLDLTVVGDIHGQFYDLIELLKVRT